MAISKEIITEIENEREYQQRRWGDESDDHRNTPADWVAYVSHHSGRWFPGGGFLPYNKETLLTFRKQMVKVATLAVAAIEWTDRILSGKNSRPDIYKPE